MNKKILKIFTWIVGIPFLLILILTILNDSSTLPKERSNRSTEQLNKLLTDGTLEVFKYNNSMYLVTSLTVLSPENLKVLLPQICKATGTDKWEEYETINIVNAHKKIAKKLPSMAEACSTPDQYFPTEGVENTLNQAQYVERIGYGIYRY